MRKKDERFVKVPPSSVGILNVHQARKNVLTGKIEVKVKYYFRDEHGKKHSTDTPWIPPEQAEKIVEALKRRKDKETKLRIKQEEDQKKITEKDFASRTIEDCLIDFHEKNNPKNLSAKSKKRVTSVRSLYTDIGGILRYHTPKFLLKKKAVDITPDDFVAWVSFLDSDSVEHEALAGRTTRRYRTAIKAFNEYLKYQGYYNENQKLTIDALILAVRIKSKKEGERTDRYVPTKKDFNKIYEHYSYVTESEYQRIYDSWDELEKEVCPYYFHKAILPDDGADFQKFRRLYWLTYFSVMFYTGMRPEESFGLVVGDINFEARTITISDSITQAERDEDVAKRRKSNLRQTKREQSKRVIPILDIYYDDLKKYIQKLQKYYDVTEKNLSKMYVWPRINSRTQENKFNFQRIKNVNRELDIICERLEIPHFSVQMFRHACPTFLIIEYHLKEEDLFNYFGHQDPQMLHNIYTKLTPKDKTKEAAHVFNKAGLLSDESLQDIQADEFQAGYLEKDRRFNRNRKLIKQ